MLAIEEGICMNSHAPQFNPRFDETMLRTFGDVCRAVDSAYIHCYETNNQTGYCNPQCPWKNKHYPNPGQSRCNVTILQAMGFVLTPEHIEREEAGGLK
jgi:hypothetical protein